MFRRTGWGKEGPAAVDGSSSGKLVLGLKRGHSKSSYDRQDDIRVVSVNPSARRRTNGLKDVRQAFQEEADVLENADSLFAYQSSPQSPLSQTIFSNPAFQDRQPALDAAGKKDGLKATASTSDGEEAGQVVAHATWKKTASRAYQSNDAVVKNWQAEFHQEYSLSPLAGCRLQAPQANQIQSYVRRKKSRLGVTTFHMYFEKGDVFLLSAKKRKTSTASHFVICCSKDDLSKKSGTCLAHLKGNLVGTQYTLFSADSQAGEGAGKELGAIRFKQTALTVTGGPRSLSVILPQMQGGGGGGSVPKPASLPDTLHACYEKAKKGELPAAALEKLSCLKTCPPVWDEKIRKYTLDFKGRVKHASVKNAQLTMYDLREQQRGTTITLMFGKASDDAFVLDYSFPLDTLQAFGVALAILDSKLCYTL